MFTVIELIKHLADIDFNFALTQGSKKATPLESALKLFSNRPNTDLDLLRLASVGLFLEQRSSQSNWHSERLAALESWYLLFWDFMEQEKIKNFTKEDKMDLITAYHYVLQQLGNPDYYDKSHSAFCRKIGRIKSQKKANAVRINGLQPKKRKKIK
jgi:hypothetical protein